MENNIMQDFFYEWLHAAKGKPLLSIKALFHVFNETRNGCPQEIGFLFSGCKFGKFYCGSDGESIIFSLEPIVRRDLDEYGRNDIFSISDEFLFSRVIKDELITASLIYGKNKNVGISFLFKNNNSLIIINLGDELFCFDKIPIKIFLQESFLLNPLDFVS